MWVADPIDGTANCVRGHLYVSVAHGVAEVGVVHARFLGETFAALRGRGARLTQCQDIRRSASLGVRGPAGSGQGVQPSGARSRPTSRRTCSAETAQPPHLASTNSSFGS